LAICLFLLVFPLAACIEDRLSVEIHTQIHGDGTCTRRVEYRLERVETEQGDSRVAIAPDDDVLRKQYRFPTGDTWQKNEETDLGLHVVTLEGKLASPQDVDGDYFRARSAHAQPARNTVSAYVDAEEGYYEYQEVLRDPSSPLAGARMLSRSALKRDQAFADAFASAFLEQTSGRTAPPRVADLRRIFREQFAEPYAKAVAAIAERPFFGPRERHELQRIGDDGLTSKELAQRISALISGVPFESIDKATEAAVNSVAAHLLDELELAGLPSPFGGELRAHFRATLVMPSPILRANACVTGDTATWEFESDDLFGRGFEMRVLASTPRP
jgi:hypothetical protein